MIMLTVFYKVDLVDKSEVASKDIFEILLKEM
jgi:hypothetical protein